MPAPNSATSASRTRDCTSATNASKRSHVIARLERLAHDAAGDQRVAQVRRLHERAAPGARAAALARVLRRSPPWSAHSSSARSSHGDERVVGRLEAQHEQRRRRCAAPVSAASPGSSSRQFDGYSPDCDSARTASAPCVKSAKRTLADTLNSGRVLHAHPRPRDHAEDPLRPDQHPVGRRPGARPGQPARLPHARRRQRPHRLDEVVDVGHQRREVPARARRDPAAERRVLERLREVAQRVAVLAQLVLEHRARSRRAWISAAREARSTSSTRSSPRRSIDTAPAYASPTRGSTPPTTLVPPPNGIAASAGRRRTSRGRRATSSSLARRARRRRAGCRTGRGTPARCRGRPCRRRGTRASYGIRGADRAPARRAARPAGRAGRRPSAAPAARRRRGSKPRCARTPAAAASTSSGGGCWSS